MTLRLNGATSGYTEIDAPAVAGSNTLVLPGGNGSAGNILGTDGAGNLSWVNGRMVLDTAKASTSGTSVDFTGIPSWAKRVTVMFDGVSTNGASLLQVQLGDSGGIETSGYAGTSQYFGTGAAAANYTSGVVLQNNVPSASNLMVGSLRVENITSNTWSITGGIAFSNTNLSGIVFYTKTLSGTLDRVRITTTNGTDTFDAGSINILYEG